MGKGCSRESLGCLGKRERGRAAKGGRRCLDNGGKLLSEHDWGSMVRDPKSGWGTGRKRTNEDSKVYHGRKGLGYAE